MISAVILTRNDASVLSRSLESLAWCDERIVIDDMSSDDTVKIAKTLKARVIVHALSDDFAQQRNIGLREAKGEWVLFVDSDEVVSKELADEIKEVTMRKSSDDEYKGYYLKRNDWFLGKWLEHGETSHVKLLRLGRRTAGEWVRPVHEIWKINGEVGELIHPLLHYPHSNVAQFLDEINWYSTLNAHHFYTSGVRTSWWQIGFYPKVKFFQNYILRLGFLDGTQGAIMAIMMSFHSFLTRAKLYVLQHQSS